MLLQFLPKQNFKKKREVFIHGEEVMDQKRRRGKKKLGAKMRIFMIITEKSLKISFP